LFCQTRFNGPIERGLVWFQTYPDEEKVTVHFDRRLYEEVDEKVYGDFDTKEIRRPDADADPDFPADSEITDDEKSSRLLNWPPKILFDLHRLVLAPFERWKLEGKSKAEDLKQSRKRRRGAKRTKSDSMEAEEEAEEGAEGGGQREDSLSEEDEGEEELTTRKRERRGGKTATSTRSRRRGKGKKGRK
jgi:ribonuclease E